MNNFKMFYRNDATNPEKNYYIKKPMVASEKYLFVLACTGGAKKGDYFYGQGYTTSSSWRYADYTVRKLRKEILFAACSSVAYHFDPTGGSLVFEHENDRVKSEQDFGMPVSSVFSCINDKQFKFDIEILIDGLKEGLLRALGFGIERIFVVLTPFAYKVAFCTAVEELNLWDKVVLFDVKTQGASSFFIKLFPLFYRIVFSKTGIFNSSYLLYLKGEQHKPVTQKRFEYWNYPAYHPELPFDVTKLLLKINNKIEYFPILKEDCSLTCQQLIDLYHLPVFEPFEFIGFDDLNILHTSYSLKPKQIKHSIDSWF